MAKKKAATKKSAPKKAARKKAAVPKKLGFEKALAERKEHFTKHGYTDEQDDSQTQGQLLKKAQFALTMDSRFYPPNTDKTFREQMEKKSHPERIAVAMSLLAAESSRLDRADAKQKAELKKAAKEAPKKEASKKESGVVLRKPAGNVTYRPAAGSEKKSAKAAKK